MTSFYFNTGGNADEEDTIEAAFDTFWTNVKSNYNGQLTLDEYRWYFSASIVPRGEPWGDAARIIDRNVSGTSDQKALPPQCAVVVSYPRPSPHRRHPGRNYLPAPSSAAMADTGRISDSFQDLIANQMEIFLEAAVTAGYQPVTIAKVGGTDTALIIPTLAVDNVFDTQRRRAWEDWTRRVTRELTTIP